MNNDIASQIISFGDLPDGWNYGGGYRATCCAIRTALRINNLLINVEDIEAFPDVSGAILVSGYYGNENLEIFIHSDGQIDLTREIDDDVNDEKNDISWDELEEYIVSWNRQ